METFLVLNGKEIDAPVDEQEQTIITLAAGELEREGVYRMACRTPR